MTPASDRKNKLLDRAVGAYLGLAAGDALGATTEFLTPGEIRARYGQHRDIIGGGWLHLKRGAVTDDTEMSLALGEAILKTGEIDARAVAEAFNDWMRSKPVDIGNTVRRGIVHYRRTGIPWIEEDEHSAGNGACMRCLPVALRYCLASENARVRASRIQAHVTHNSPIADAGSEAVLQMLAAALKDARLAELIYIAEGLVEQFPQYRYDRKSVTNPSGWIVETLQAVFQAVFQATSLEEGLVDLANRGGDSDTTAAIGGMLLGAMHGEQAIPSRWLAALDSEVISACRKQAEALIELACVGNPVPEEDDERVTGQPLPPFGQLLTEGVES